eukprot:gnl/MRDRNA2_/MRDRNA2_108223_c0_seq1.p1 gnl/MRDRNA2_/MRDRNA2_108223_c0~~gnl/MRDRNA2_/MRDRNA2_108223_c0_seq1.p1  ORF type:complete len:361 (-),score=73.01 gnl/MRDRNA2_/MRDRNA2_108223_c0_seq1:53-1135(-)
MEDCPVCDGTGFLLKSTCPLCEGESLAESSTLTSTESDDSHANSDTFDSACLTFAECHDSTGSDGNLEGVAEIAEGLRTGSIRRVVVCTGAGISVSSGIPDFRSPGGLFERIREELGEIFPEVLQEPEIALSRGFANAYPKEHARVLDQHMMSEWSTAQPGDCHLLLSLLARKGLLQRIYTQNVDGLHQRAGVPEELMVEVHGSVAHGNLVLYGDELPAHFFQIVSEDFPKDSSRDKCDLMLIIGSSLQVAPFCGIPNIARRDVPRVLVTRCAHKCYQNAFSKSRSTMCYSESDLGGVSVATSTKIGERKVSLAPQWGHGSKYRKQWVFDCDADEWALRIARLAGWSEELENLRHTIVPP